ncbi:MAG: hypothetical protein KGL35_11595 [Bradyrhizobium sp.]|jgi:hypothetical protein|nr:hypothetical protein [Bradyrhizobium sp.]
MSCLSISELPMAEIIDIREILRARRAVGCAERAAALVDAELPGSMAPTIRAQAKARAVRLVSIGIDPHKAASRAVCWAKSADHGDAA